MTVVFPFPLLLTAVNFCDLDSSLPSVGDGLAEPPSFRISTMVKKTTSRSRWLVGAVATSGVPDKQEEKVGGEGTRQK